MYWVSHRSNPKFSAQVYSCAVVINFNTTLLSLENQLLDIVFELVDVKLAKERASLHGSVVASRKQLQALEDGLLEQIALCDGNLLDNPNISKLLECTKIEVRELNALATHNRNTFADIQAKRNDFRLIALKGASIFYVIADMGALNSFYQHAMCDFIKIFTQIMLSIRINDGQSSSSDQCCDLNQRLLKIIADLSKRIYNLGSMGIFHKDKLLFSLRIAMELEYCDGRLLREEMDFLLKPIAELCCVENTQSIGWLSNEQYNCIYQLMVTFPRAFDGILVHIQMNLEQWKVWCDADTPETFDLPEPYSNRTTNFQVKFRQTIEEEEDLKKKHE